MSLYPLFFHQPLKCRSFSLTNPLNNVCYPALPDLQKLHLLMPQSSQPPSTFTLVSPELLHDNPPEIRTLRQDNVRYVIPHRQQLEVWLHVVVFCTDQRVTLISEIWCSVTPPFVCLPVCLCACPGFCCGVKRP